MLNAKCPVRETDGQLIVASRFHRLPRDHWALRIEHRALSNYLDPALPPDHFSSPPLESRSRSRSCARAWLVERAGFGKGYPGDGAPARLSTKHALALTNRGNATATDVIALARTVRDGVRAAFGIDLTPEPSLIGCCL